MNIFTSTLTAITFFAMGTTAFAQGTVQQAATSQLPDMTIDASSKLMDFVDASTKHLPELNELVYDPAKAEEIVLNFEEHGLDTESCDLLGKALADMTTTMVELTNAHLAREGLRTNANMVKLIQAMTVSGIYAHEEMCTKGYMVPVQLLE